MCGRAQPLADRAGTPGEVMQIDEAGIVVGCGSGALRLRGAAASGRAAPAGARVAARSIDRSRRTARSRGTAAVIQIQRDASRALLAVLNGRSLTPVLEETWLRAPRLQPGERAAIQDLAFGTCRWLGTLRALLSQLLRAPLTDPQVEALLLVALYQLQWTRAAPHAVVNFAVRTCAAVRKPAAAGLVNAVLRNFLRQRALLLQRARETEPGRYSYPQWWIDQLRHDWPDDYAGILEAGNLHPPMTLRVNRRRVSAQDMLRQLERAGIGAQYIAPVALLLAKPVPVRDLPGFEQGLVSVQDLAAQHAAPLLDLALRPARPRRLRGTRRQGRAHAGAVRCAAAGAGPGCAAVGARARRLRAARLERRAACR